MPDRGFLANDFADFPDVWVKQKKKKKSKIRPVVGDVSLQQHLLLVKMIVCISGGCQTNHLTVVGSQSQMPKTLSRSNNKVQKQ